MNRFLFDQYVRWAKSPLFNGYSEIEVEVFGDKCESLGRKKIRIFGENYFTICNRDYSVTKEEVEQTLPNYNQNNNQLILFLSINSGMRSSALFGHLD